jgi:lipoyl synthase
MQIYLTELRKIDVDVVTFGQYMRPTKRHMKVHRYVEPSEFDRWKRIADDMNFLYVASGPLVRSSYKASELCYLPNNFRMTIPRLENTSSRTYCGVKGEGNL